MGHSSFGEISPNILWICWQHFLRWAETVHTWTMVSHLEAEQGWWTFSGLFHSGHLGLTAECLSYYPLGLTTCMRTRTSWHCTRFQAINDVSPCSGFQCQHNTSYITYSYCWEQAFNIPIFILTDVELELFILHSKSLVKLNSWLHWVKAIQVS